MSTHFEKTTSLYTQLKAGGSVGHSVISRHLDALYDEHASLLIEHDALRNENEKLKKSKAPAVKPDPSLLP